MQTIKIGYRRLFEAVECSIADADHIRVDKQLINGHFLHLYLGPNPIFGKMVATGRAKYVTRNPMPFHMAPYEPLSNPPHGFYTEIICCEEIQIPDDEYSKIENNDVSLKEKYLKKARDNEEKYKVIVNWFAGMIGLRLHRLFVVEPIVENYFVSKPDLSYIHMPLYGLVLENIKIISINSNGKTILENYPNVLPTDNDALFKCGTAFEWLLRAWTIRDSLNRFTALFIPLEIILNIFDFASTPSNQDLIRSLEGVIQDAELLKATKERIQNWRPSLNKRFELLAEKYKLEGWEKDIKAFKKFNRMRNDLFHGHTTKISELVVLPEDADTPEEAPGKINDSITMKLEDIVERYLCKAIFGDENVYLSFWREQKNKLSVKNDINH